MSAPLTPATVQQLAQTAATSPAHLDPQVVQRVCQEWEVLRETIGCGEAVLQAYDMTPKGLVEMANWLSSETNGEPEAREAEIVAALRSTAVAFAAHEGWLHLAVAERNDARTRAEQAESALTAAQAEIRRMRTALQDADDEAEQDIHALIAEVRRLRERQEDDTVLLGTIAGERDAALAERDEARHQASVLSTAKQEVIDALITERDAARRDVERFRNSMYAVEESCLRQRRHAEQAGAALTEARRVLREVDKRVIQCSMCYAMIGGYRPEPHTPDCAIAAVLAQEEPHG